MCAIITARLCRCHSTIRARSDRIRGPPHLVEDVLTRLDKTRCRSESINASAHHSRICSYAIPGTRSTASSHTVRGCVTWIYPAEENVDCSLKLSQPRGSPHCFVAELWQDHTLTAWTIVHRFSAPTERSIIIISMNL